MVDVLVCRDGEMADGDVRIVAAGPKEAGVFRHNGQYFAYRNICPHQGGPVCEGLIIPKVLAVIGPDKKFHGNSYDESEMHFVCPWHGYEYQLETGVCAADPALRLQKYNVVEREGAVYVEL
jgi:nitrite reductase/ring-hydroxylating ferredoxin subunit